MSSKIKKIILVVFIAICGLFILSACESHTLESEKDRYDLTVDITYHANGGEFNNNDNKALICYQDGSYALNLGTDNIIYGDIILKYDQHTLVGWYYAETDSDGNVVYEDEKKGLVKLSDQKFDFTKPLEKGDVIHIGAKWLADTKLEILLANESVISNELIYNGTTYKSGDVVSSYQFDASGSVSKPSLDPMTKKRKGPEGYVLAEYYYDIDCTKVVEWPVESTEENENVQIYAKYLSDEWTVIENQTGLYQMFTVANNSGKFFIKNDINASSESVKNVDNIVFSGEIRGNGCTITGLTVRNVSVGEGSYVSLFGTITKDAKISDLTLKDFKVEYTNNTKPNDASINASFLAKEIEAGATIENLKIDGGEMKVRIYGNATLNGSDPTLVTTLPIISIDSSSDGMEILNVIEFKIIVPKDQTN